MPNEAKNKPATPLPWSRVDWMNGFCIGANNHSIAYAGMDHGESTIDILDGDADYLIQSANAYPRLVELMRDAALGIIIEHRADELLRELGEL